MIKTYCLLTKPGIILGNIITAAAGFALASKGVVNYSLLLATLFGLALIIASAGVFNCYTDRLADAKMVRTRNRPLVAGLVSKKDAIVYALFLVLVGMLFLGVYTNLLTVFIALIGFFVYLVLYTFLKYRSIYGTIVGSIAGAVPPIVGYCAASNRFDIGAFILFMVVVLWQMPHFFAIAIYRLEDYTTASIPVMPVQKGTHLTKIHMLLYIIVFTATALMLTFMGYTGAFFGIMTAMLGLSWLGLCINGFWIDKTEEARWAYKMFIYSLVVITTISIAIPFDVI